jgi:hypothetical protein
MDCPIEIPPEISTNTIVKKSNTPQNISEFKEALIAVLISYFKNNIVLLNNLIELSDKIITKTDNLRLLIALLLSIPKAVVQVEVEEITMKGFCGTVCKKIPRYRKIKDIIINKNSLLKFLTINIIFKWEWSLIFLWSVYCYKNK